MTDITVKDFSKKVGLPVNRLMDQLELAGVNKKNENEKEQLLDDLLEDFKEVNRLKKIEYLEGEFAKNLDENSFSELIKLKNQINRE